MHMARLITVGHLKPSLITHKLPAQLLALNITGALHVTGVQYATHLDVYCMSYVNNMHPSYNLINILRFHKNHLALPNTSVSLIKKLV